MSMEYMAPEGVTDVRVTPVPNHGQTVSGYGDAIPTRHMIRYLGVWRRGYVRSYGNGGTSYVKVRGADMVLDPDTEQRLSAAG